MQSGWRTWIGRDRWIVRVSGELDVESGPRLRDFLAAELTRHETACMVDLSKVTFIDSSGLHALVASLRRAQLLGRPFSLVLDSAGRIERLLEMTGLVGLFDVESTAPASPLASVAAVAGVTDLRAPAPASAEQPQTSAVLAGS